MSDAESKIRELERRNATLLSEFEKAICRPSCTFV